MDHNNMPYNYPLLNFFCPPMNGLFKPSADEQDYLKENLICGY